MRHLPTLCAAALLAGCTTIADTLHGSLTPPAGLGYAVFSMTVRTYAADQASAGISWRGLDNAGSYRLPPPRLSIRDALRAYARAAADVSDGLLADAAHVAMAFLGAPYLWGGRESLGLDCSGLVQQALLACGV